MADTNVAIQPSTPQQASPPAAIKVFSAVDANGLPTLIQATAPVDEFGRPLLLLSEATGLSILAALRDIHKALIDQGQGGFYPSERGLSQ